MNHDGDYWQKKNRCLAKIASCHPKPKMLFSTAFSQVVQ